MLDFNLSKCKFMCIFRKAGAVFNKYAVRGHELSRTTLYLGIYINERLSWEHQASKTVTKCSKLYEC